MASTASRAKALAEAGFAVFPTRPDSKRPYGSDDWRDGLKAATLDPWLAWDTFEKYPKAGIGIHCGRSGIVVLDIDYKEDENGNVLKDGFDSLERAWLEIPESFKYTSVGGFGQHIYYAAPEGADFNGAGRYRRMEGVDRRAGESYVVIPDHAPIPDKSTFAPAPEWLCDPAAVRSAEEFQGTVKDWYESLEPGKPNLLVRNAMDRIEKKYREAGNDFDHAALIESQFQAIRLGAEGNPGVPVLLERIEDLFMEREGSHTRPVEEWAHEFAEGLASGIKRYGDAIDLRKSLPPFDISTAPSAVPDRLLIGEPGDKDVFRETLRALLEASDDDLYVTSALWNAPRTRDLAREWGLQFVHERVVDARSKPEPVRENPTLPTPEPSIPVSVESVNRNTSGSFLSEDEIRRAQSRRTFIDKYLDASASKGFWNRTYDIPAAWTCLSMAFGLRAYIPKGVKIGTNLWFLPVGYSGTGKSASIAFQKNVLNHMLKDGEGYYNLGAVSSPEAILLELLTRDGKPSMILQDEASTFFQSVKTKDWMKQLEYDFSNYYMGEAGPSNKLSLRDLRGKSATTSFNIYMIATPDRLLKLIDTDMFATGFMARFNWMWADPPVNDETKYRATETEIDSEKGAPPVTFDLAGDLLHAREQFPEPVKVWGTKEAVARLEKAHEDFDRGAQKQERYDALEPAITRLGRETIWKCAALLALYEGRTTFTLDDALSALLYAEEWYRNLLRVVETTSEGEFAGDAAEIEAYIHSQGGSVSEAALNHRFRSMIRYSPRELSDRIQFLVMSGRINREEKDRKVKYVLNGSAE